MSKALPRVPVSFNFTGVKTNENDRYLQPGDFTSLINQRHTVNNRLEKRLGNDKTTISTFTGATYAGPVTDIVASSSVIVRDTSNQIFAKAPDGVGYFKGIDLRAHPTLQHIENLATVNTANKPAIARRSNGDIFYFSMGVGGGGSNTGFQVTVLASDGSVKHRSAIKSAVDMTAYSVATDAADKVWLAYITTDDPDGIYTYGFTAAGAIDVSNTITVANHEWTDVRLRLLGNSELALAALSLDDTDPTSYTIKNYHAYLNTTTGAVKGSPAAVSTSYTSADHATDPALANGLSIAESAGDATSWYYGYWRGKSTGELEFIRHKVNLSTLAITTTLVLDTMTVALETHVYIGQSTGKVTANNAEVWHGSILHMDPLFGPDGTRTSNIYRYSYNGSAVTETTIARSAYLAGDTFTVGTSTYILSGFDDMTDLREPGAQRGYFVRDATTGQIVTEILNGLGGQVCFAGGADATGRFIMVQTSGHTVTPIVSGSSVYIPLLEAGSTEVTHEPVLATVDFAATYYSWAPNIIPGGIPKYVSPQDAVTELTPIHYPYQSLEISGNGTAGTTNSRNYLTYRYVTVNAAGERVPSAPYITEELTFEDYVSPDDEYFVNVPTLRHAIGPTWIEVFMSENLEISGADTSLYLVKRLKNSTTADTVTLTIEPSLHEAGFGELLDTTNLEARLVNGSVPPARLATVWRDRLFLAGTSYGDILYSQEKRGGHGYEFNETLSVEWQDGTGPITAICVLNFDALVVFRRDAVGLITGPGPLPAGPNNFVVQTISVSKGTTNPKSVVQGPLGVYFFNTADNRPNVITGATITQISQGFESYLAQTPTGSVHNEALGVVRWYMSSGKQICLDYLYPLTDQPAGSWREDSNSNLPAAVGACVISGAAVMVEAGSASVARTWQVSTDFDDDGTFVLADMTLGRLGLAGMLNEFDLEEVQISSTRLGGDSGYTYTIIDDQANQEPHMDIPSTTADVMFQSAVSRTREIQLRIQESSATGRGRSFDGVKLIVRPRGQRNFWRRIA